MKKELFDKIAKEEATRYLGKRRQLKSYFEAHKEVEEVLSRILCGCQDSEAADEAFSEILALFKPTEYGHSLDRIWESDYCKKHGEGLVILMLYWMTELDLAEHGGSVFGSWLTPLGEEVRKYYVGCENSK